MSIDRKNDVFAEIAAQRTIYRDGSLVEPQPPKLEDIYLPANNDRQAAFVPEEKINSAKQLASELENYRRQYKPFMQNYAPKQAQTKQKLILEDFDWRIQTDSDKKDFLSVLAGKGQWQPVKVPHYGEPLGLAATYYRTTFNITRQQLDKGAAFICFKGVDYKANVFINGSYLGSHEGFFAPFEFDFTDCAIIGENTLVVKVENDYIMGGNNSWDGRHCGDKIYAATGLGYDEPYQGWHHCPPGMGIYQDVFVEFKPRIFISDIFVRPLPQKQAAEVNIEITGCDAGEKPASIVLSLYGQNFNQTVFENLEYTPKSDKINGLNDDLGIAKAKADGSYNKPVQLYIERGKNRFCIPVEIKNPRIWDSQTPWLYQIQAGIVDENKAVIDTDKQHFGMRSFTIDEQNTPKGALHFNDKPIRLRGANTMGHEQQCVFKKDFDQLIDDILLAKICNMNFLRLTQRPVQPEIYDYCDMLGMLIQTDLPTFGCITKTQYIEALKQTAEMEKLVRSHPCCIMLSYINEPFPNGKNQPHRNISRAEMEDFFRAADDIVKHLNPDRVTKPCDGDYDPPSPGIQDRHCYPCWYNGQGIDIGRLVKGYWQPTKKDWYYGCGEFGTEGLERAEIMKKYYPKKWLPESAEQEAQWSPNQIYRAQTGSFHYFFFDSQDSLDNWVSESQDHQSRSLKMMTEAFRRDNRMITFAVHLFIDAFPSGWMKTIMDCERYPKKGYFAYRDALATILVSIRTDRTKFFAGEAMSFEVWLCNDTPEAQQGLMLHYQLEDKNGNVVFSQKTKADAKVCQSTFQGFLKLNAPDAAERTAYTLRAALIDNNGKIINENHTEIEVFEQINTDQIDAAVIGDAKLAKELGINITAADKSNAILITDYNQYKDNQQQIDKLVEEGAVAVFTELTEEKKYEICGSIVDIRTSRFNPLHFASRKTGHRLVEGFDKFDFNYWYDENADMITAILEHTFTADDFEPILTSGNTDDNGNWSKALACAEKKHGKGSFIVNQIKLTGRTKTNPTAKLFVKRLLGAKED